MTRPRLKVGARCRFRARPELVGTIVGKWQAVKWPWFVKWDGHEYAGDPDNASTYDGPFSTAELEAIE